ncbi:MAG TPA: maltose ABC transporter substrate-binding protein [Spirochaetota bacterium]|nr:maltose ABC transporter substrate-binding protein [Spirochaetota bacterium]HOS32482.1 maltose ABC transporter substrate-binding protein [Spirochaetota bacterium]HOS54819.1 maltose ABC transporter substrate-binding protein [Spirochaetota bacterium]HQF76774.1 maltose ABC transporter substrate-binding protein [Spirochaetota bacterium]HQH30841.1 maltose ABC transporter substrate-binding protein [Spirochaetota bacterium]
MKNSFKLVVVCILVVLMAFPVIAQRKKIVIWCTDKEVAGFEPLKKEFKKKTRIDVITEIQAEPRSKFIQAAKAGTGPDILVGAHDWVGELAKNGLITELNLKDSDKAKYFPVSIDGFTYSSKLYGIPYCVEALVLIYNKKLIKNAPTTWEKLVQEAKGMTKGDKYGFLYGIDNNFYNNFPFIGSQGGYIFKNVGGKYDILDVGLDNAGALEGSRFIYEFVKQGIVPTSANNGTVESTFKDGKVAMIMDGPWNIKSYATTVGDIGVSKLPTLNGKKTVPFVGARGFMINNSSKMMNESKDFIINYAGEFEGQLSMFKSGGRPPAHVKANLESQKLDPFVKPVVDSVNDGVAMPNVKAMAVVFNYAAGMVDKFKTGETTVENAVKSATKTIRDEISSKQSRYE